MKRGLEDEYDEVQQIEREGKARQVVIIVLMAIWVLIVGAFGAGILHPEWLK